MDIGETLSKVNQGEKKNKKKTEDEKREKQGEQRFSSDIVGTLSKVK